MCRPSVQNRRKRGWILHFLRGEGGELHGHVARTHHHLTMVVVEIGFVLERMTDDEYENSGKEGRFSFLERNESWEKGWEVFFWGFRRWYLERENWFGMAAGGSRKRGLSFFWKKNKNLESWKRGTGREVRGSLRERVGTRETWKQRASSWEKKIEQAREEEGCPRVGNFSEVLRENGARERKRKKNWSFGFEVFFFPGVRFQMRYLLSWK